MKVAQFRYYKNNIAASNITKEQLTDPNSTSSPLLGKNIVQLGIQGPAGMHFSLNNTSVNRAELIIGSTGTYQLNVNGFTVITSVCFNSNDIDTCDQLIIDVIYWEGGN